MIESTCNFKSGDVVNLIARHICSIKNYEVAEIHLYKYPCGTGFLMNIDKKLCKVSGREIKIKSSIVPIRDIQKWIPNSQQLSAKSLEDAGFVGISINKHDSEKEKVFIVNKSCVTKI